MAKVHLAKLEKRKREVAAKDTTQHSRDAEFCDGLISEEQLTARLYHRHIMTVSDIGEACGNFFMATEVLSRSTLEERLPTLHSTVDKLLILREVAEGLGFAHSHQLTHRDIKPGNVLAAVLRDRFGFEVRVIADPTRLDLLLALLAFRQSLASEDFELIYFAGHGEIDAEQQGYWISFDGLRDDPKT